MIVTADRMTASPSLDGLATALARLAASFIFASAAACPALAATHTIVIDGTSFQPQTLTVARGDRVTWVNRDPFPHTATASGNTSGNVSSNASASASGNASAKFDSKSIAAGKSWTWTARDPGSYDYICTLHPTMKGTLVVK